LISLLANERVTHDGNKKAQVMKDCLRRHDNKMKKIPGSMHSKQIKHEKGLSLNQDIVFRCIYAKRSFLDIGNQS